MPGVHKFYGKITHKNGHCVPMSTKYFPVTFKDNLSNFAIHFVDKETANDKTTCRYVIIQQVGNETSTINGALQTKFLTKSTSTKKSLF